MKNRIVKLAFTGLLLGVMFLTSCKKDKAEPVATIEMSIESNKININVAEELKITSKVLDDKKYEYEWRLNDVFIGNADSLLLYGLKYGVYTLSFEAKAEGVKYMKNYSLNVAPVSVETSNNLYVNTLFEFLPAPGQFVNKSPGDFKSAVGILGKQGMVSLGAWGGYIVLGFNRTVVDQEGKEDIIIYGNPSSNFSEPGIIWVMKDANGNGLPDDVWYEIPGSEYNKAGYIRNYSVTYTRPENPSNDIAWKDNIGNTGFVKTNTFHKQAYFPQWVLTNEYTLTGSILPSTNINMSNPSYITSAPFAFGYADNIVGGDKIDISTAIDANGNKANLKGIDFIKIQTGIQANMGWLGELSTEVVGVADLSLIK